MPDRSVPKRRFVVDGDVPVVVLGRRDQGTGVSSTPAASPPGSRLREIEAALEVEQNARRHSERLLAEARATIHDLQTKIGHANLARDEAVAAAHSLRSDMATLTTTLNAERDARIQGEATLRQVSERAEIGDVRRQRMQAPVTDPVANLVKRRGRPLGSVNGVRKPRVTDPKPVRWW
jgi:hypothetical protein